jgi:hypothetical protein
VDRTLKTQENVIEKLESSMAALGLLDNASFGLEDDEDDSESEMSSSVDNRADQVVTGNLNRGQRIDYMLQEKEIEAANEYVAALAAHSCYWFEKDLSLFLARQICLRDLERTTETSVTLARHDSLDAMAQTLASPYRAADVMF